MCTNSGMPIRTIACQCVKFPFPQTSCECVGWNAHASGRLAVLPFLVATCHNACVERAATPPATIHVTEQPEQTSPRGHDAPRPLANHLAARLRELRARRGLTQDHVAKRLGCHESAVSRWESGSRFPTGEDLVSLADLFEVSTDDLLGRGRQYATGGSALVDMRLLESLSAAESTAEFDALIAQHEEQAVWLPVPEGAVLVPVAEAMRWARKVADKHKDSQFVDRLFRPRT
jgi:HTH-type transcriptional regulator, cell division transcriptional repressor